jgi:flagellar protein FlbD
MIEVTRLNGSPMVVNSDLIKIAESSPDTMLTLIHGEKLIVRESCAEVLEKVLAYRATLLSAVAARSKNGDLPRLVAMASLHPETGVVTAPGGSGATPTTSGAQAGRNGGVRPITGPVTGPISGPQSGPQAAAIEPARIDLARPDTARLDTARLDAARANMAGREG